MKAWIMVSLALAAGPAFGQKVYKCPGPNGKAVYQQQRCPEGGGRMHVQDNGSSSGDVPEPAVPTPAQTAGPASSVPESNLRSGEKEMLRDVRAREEADAQRRHEQAMQAERAAVAKEAIRVEKAYQAQLRAQHCARYPTSCR